METRVGHNKYRDGKWLNWLDQELFTDLDAPAPQNHFPHDYQMRSIFAHLRTVVEPGSTQEFAFLRIFESYGYFHEEYCKLKWPFLAEDENESA